MEPHDAVAPIDFHETAHALVRRVAMRTVGVRVGGVMYRVGSAEVCESGPHGPPGMIVNARADSLRVSVADGSPDVRLMDLRDPDGNPPDFNGEDVAVGRRLDHDAEPVRSPDPA